MTEGEIRRIYKSAKNKKKQISILAELNCCSTGKIIEIVHGKDRGKEESAEWIPTPEQKTLMNRLDELDAMIKPLEDEYKRTADALKKSFKCG